MTSPDAPDAPARERREPWHKIKFTPDAYAELRRLYEQTPETGRTIAAIAGISHTSLKGYAAREGWVKFRRPPIDLPPAAKLSAKLALGAGAGGEGEGAQNGALPPLERGRPPGEARRVAVADADATIDNESPRAAERPQETPTPTLPLAGGGSGEAQTGGGEPAPAQPSVTLDSLLADGIAEAKGALATLKAERARGKAEGWRVAHEEQAAHAMRCFSDALERLLEMQRQEQRRTEPRSDPDDLDARRAALAQRIDAICAEWMEAEAAGLVVDGRPVGGVAGGPRS